MSAYYNEHDPFKSAVLREAIKEGAIAPGDVDERSIEDVKPDELVGYTQCHFFAGGGFWSAALRLAGWPDDRPVWTGSCPCPSFSAAGKGEGFDDARHLWPVWFRLIVERCPGVLFGEQVASAIAHGWLDLVSTDLEAQGYAFAAPVLGAHSAGAFHIRQRLYFLAVAESERRQQCAGAAREHTRVLRAPDESRECLQPACGNGAGLVRVADDQRGGREIVETPRLHAEGPRGNHTDRRSESEQLGFAQCAGLEGFGGHGINGHQPGWIGASASRSSAATGTALQNGSAGAAESFWADADWLFCRDGWWRPVEPGTFPLAAGNPARVGRLRMYGDAICVPVARLFIEAAIEAIDHYPE